MPAKITLSQEEIASLRKRRKEIVTTYGQRDALFMRYEDIYFMRNVEKPKDAGVDPNDWKVTASPGGRDKITGLKRILDTSDIHIKVKDRKKKGQDKAPESDAIETALKTMLSVSGEYRIARTERDTNLAAILYGPVVLSVDSVDDLIKTKTKDANGQDKEGVSRFVVRQLEAIKKRTPFLIDTINPKESFPEWGRYGLVGHVQEYTVRGSELLEQWGADLKLSPGKEYVVSDFFHYEKRLVEAGNTILFAGEWMEEGDTEGLTTIPIFVRLAGGSTLFSKPEEQLESFLYSFAKGEWDKRENLFWTYVFTAIYNQGLPGPTLVRDPDDTSPIKVDYKGGVKVITARGKLEDVQVIRGDLLNIKQMMDEQTGKSTIQEQTIGGSAQDTTFSGYVMSMNAGKLPSVDPAEAQEFAYRDCFLHVLQRIKAGNVQTDLIDPNDIPDDVDIEVTLEPNLQQDDLRNAQIMAQIKTSGANVSDEWLNSNVLKIQDSAAMFRQVTKENFKKALAAAITQDPNLMQQFIAAAMGQKPAPAGPPQVPPGGPTSTEMAIPPEAPPEQAMLEQPVQGPGMETPPMTDALTNQLMQRRPPR